VHARCAAVLAAVTAIVPASAAAQPFTHRGYAETTFTLYPQTTPQDSGRFVAEALFHWEPTLRHGRWKFDAAFDARTDSHHLTQRTWEVTYWDRSTQRPAFAVGKLMASWARGPVTVEVGKQLIRWGKTDILVPTDRFAPRDYLKPPATELLGVTAARLTLASSSDSLEVVFTPRMTPSRAPLLNQRWTVPPPEAAGLPLRDGGAQFPGGTQTGLRWNHVGRHLEHSISFFRGFQHLPLFDGSLRQDPFRLEVRRRYAQLTAVGADMAAPLPWFTLKAEAAWLQSDTADAAEYVLYVVQIERQSGEWLFLGGYTGEHETRAGTAFRFAPDRGLARAFVGRASRTLDANRSLVFEGVVRQNGDGVYGKVEYAHGFGDHWRLIASASAFGGSDDDYLGQYSRNGFGALTVRYSF
jgi:hypothetical protein